MLADAARIKEVSETENTEGATVEVEHRELKTKDDIKNYLKGMM